MSEPSHPLPEMLKITNHQNTNNAKRDVVLRVMTFSGQQMSGQPHFSPSKLSDCKWSEKQKNKVKITRTSMRQEI